MIKKCETCQSFVGNFCDRVDCEMANVDFSQLGTEPKLDLVNHPPHYTSHPSGVECITIVEHYGFSLGNAIKYIWRAGLKGSEIEDLKKARWYLDREIARREKTK